MIDAALGEFAGALDYRGRVLGDDKAKFYRDIDVFVFPTTYANEAQPIVVFEAKAAGKDVIAYDRACIRKQLDETDLLIPVDGEFTNMAIGWQQRPPKSRGEAGLRDQAQNGAQAGDVLDTVNFMYRSAGNPESLTHIFNPAH
jgi:glycosyltransferase involved in cell wall biosynthesis